LGEISEEGLNKVFCFKGANCVHKSILLIVFPGIKVTYIQRLNQVRLMGGKFDYPDLIILYCKNKSWSCMASSTIYKKYMPRTIWGAVIMLDKMI
jgi:hypothetical protein